MGIQVGLDYVVIMLAGVEGGLLQPRETADTAAEVGVREERTVGREETAAGI